VIAGAAFMFLVLSIAALIRYVLRLRDELKFAWHMAEHATTQHMRTALLLELARDQLRGVQHSRFIQNDSEVN
jgi:hypothetical protein